MVSGQCSNCSVAGTSRLAGDDPGRGDTPCLQTCDNTTVLIREAADCELLLSDFRLVYPYNSPDTTIQSLLFPKLQQVRGHIHLRVTPPSASK